jgi:WD40 repeat protein
MSLKRYNLLMLNIILKGNNMKKIQIFKLLPLLVVLFLGACSSNNPHPQVKEKRSVKKLKPKVSIKSLFADSLIQNIKKPKFKKRKFSSVIRIFKGHTDLIDSVAISPNGKYIVSGSDDETIKLWDINTGELLRSFEGHTDEVWSATISPNGKYIVSASGDETIKLWDIKTGRLIRRFKGHVEPIQVVAITKNGKYIISGSNDKTIKLWNIKNGRLVMSFEGHKGPVRSVTITPNRKYIVSGSWDDTIKLWNINTGKLIKSFKGHKDDVSSVAITPNGKYIVSGSSDNTIKLWNIKTGRWIRSFKGHTNSVWSVAITPNGKNIVSGRFDNTIKLWDINTRKILRNINTGKILRNFEGHTDEVWSVTITPNGKYIVSGSFDNTIKLWDIYTGKLLRSFEEHIDDVNSVAISPNGKYIVSGCCQTIKLWYLEAKVDKKARYAWNEFVEYYTASNEDLIDLNALAKEYPNIRNVKNNLKKLFEYNNRSNGFSFDNFQRLSETQQSDYLNLNNKDRQLFSSLDSKKQREFLKESANKKSWFNW